MADVDGVDEGVHHQREIVLNQVFIFLTDLII